MAHGSMTHPPGLQARRTFHSQTAALRRKVHSSYQRGLANALTRLRLMHLLEDNSTGEQRGAGLWAS